MSLSNLIKNPGGLLSYFGRDNKPVVLFERYAKRLESNSTPAASTAWKTLAQLTLPKGQYLAFGMLDFIPIGFTGTRVLGALSLSNNALDDGSVGNLAIVGAAGLVSSDDNIFSVGCRFLDFTIPNSVYLVGRADYSVLGTSAFSTNTFLQVYRIGGK